MRVPTENLSISMTLSILYDRRGETSDILPDKKPSPGDYSVFPGLSVSPSVHNTRPPGHIGRKGILGLSRVAGISTFVLSTGWMTEV